MKKTKRFFGSLRSFSRPSAPVGAEAKKGMVKIIMNNNKSRKLIALILAALMAGSSIALTASAVEDGAVQESTEDPSSSKSGLNLSNIKDVLSTPAYEEYMKNHEDASAVKSEVKIALSSLDLEKTTAETELLRDYNGKSGEALRLSESGEAVFNVDVPEDGLYSLKFDYSSPSEKPNAIERTLKVNGSVPYKEARGLSMKKAWVPAYTEQEDGTMRFRTDLSGSEIRPALSTGGEWQEYVLSDTTGYYAEPLYIYLDKGENTITLEGVREELIIADLTLFAPEELPSYEDVLKEYEKRGYKNAESEPVYMHAETPSAVSDYWIVPLTDTSSSMTEPQAVASDKFNTMGGGRWSESGQWMEYTFSVEESAIYTIVTRFLQDLGGRYTSLKLYVDGKIPYKEAASLKFNSKEGWQTGRITDGEKDLSIYLEKGEHTIRFETTLGDMGEIIRHVSNIQSSLNSDYLEILRLTGAYPDAYRDYGFSRIMPDVMQDLVKQSRALYEVVDYMKETAGDSELTTTLKQVADTAAKMGADDDNVAKSMSQFKTDVGTIGSWVQSMSSQYLELDYLMIQSPDADVPKADAGFFSKISYEIKRFMSSFFTDYNALQTAEGEEAEAVKSVEVWSQSGRDKTQITKNLVESRFTPDTGIQVNLKLVANTTLLPSVLAGIGPDIALEGMTGTVNVVNTIAETGQLGSINDYAIRGAVIPIQDFEGFDEVKDTIFETAFDPVSLYGEVYGLPVLMGMNMMFYRSDILSNLDLEIPETWDELLSTVPVLQFNNMELGLQSDVNTFATFVIQRGGKWWADDGMRINFDNNTVLEAYESMCNMFTQYSLPLTFDATNRFRTGEVPLFIMDYMTYNGITVFATEIAGLWGFTKVPGTVRADGSVDHTTVGASDAIIMLRGCKDESSAWDFMKWYAGADYQSEYANELVSILGDAAKSNPANKEAVSRQSWTADEQAAIDDAISDVICLPQYPGTYFISRYVKFGVQNAYNDGADPVEELLGCVNAINKEINRKRNEFEFETVPLGSTLAEKREGQALEIIEALSSENSEKYRSQIDAAKAAIDMLDTDEKKIDALKACADSLNGANSELFGEAAGYLTDAASALESYNN